MGNNESKRTFLAIFLAIAIVASWQYFFPPVAPVSAPVVSDVKTATESKSNDSGSALTIESSTSGSSAPELSTFVIDDYELILDKNLTILNMKGPFLGQDTKTIFGAESTLRIGFWKNGDFAKATYFSAQHISENGKQILRFVLENDLGTIDFFRDEQGLLSVSSHLIPGLQLSFQFQQHAKDLGNGHVKSFIFNHSSVERFTVGKDEQGEGKAKWFGVDFGYNLFAVVPQEGHLFRFSANENESASLMVRQVEEKNIESFKLVFAPKNYDLLKDFGSHLDLSIDFGFFAFLAVPILRGLQFFYKFIPNYGVGIILLTLLIRLLTFPLQYKSFKSMKKMQKLQPEMAKLKEKHQADPQRMQKETMELFKKHGANPMGGCLPLILQMPIFLAFYRVLNTAIELVDAPFLGWIVDLSSKDPYYVLPVIMTASMVAQQRLTPATTTDKTQKMMMNLMPIIFGFFMVSLPSGLVLYMCVSTIFGIGQQLLVYRMID